MYTHTHTNTHTTHNSLSHTHTQHTQALTHTRTHTLTVEDEVLQLLLRESELLPEGGERQHVSLHCHAGQSQLPHLLHTTLMIQL